ncbi:MAG: PAS domain S-box protein [Candidatus Omnitrophota bacterium]
MPRKSVLFVDDDDTFLKEYAELFGTHKYQVFTAQSGKETKKILKKIHPNIAFLDKKLSDMDGQDLIKEFKSKSKNTSLVVMTGHASVKSTIRGLREGVADYLVKPLDPEKILKRAEEIIKSQQQEHNRIKKLHHWADLQNQKYRYLFEGSCGAIFIVDALDMTVVDCNSSALALMGHKKSALVGRSLISFFLTQDRQKHEGFFKSCVQSSLMTMDTNIIDSQKRTIPVSMNVIFLKIGRKKYAQVIMHDLRRLVQAKNVVMEVQHKYRLLAETAVEGIYQVDSTGRFVFVNEAFLDIFGYRIEEMLGKSFMLIVADSHAQEAQKKIKGALNGEVVKGEFICRHKSGREIFVYFSVVPLKTGGKVDGFTGILMDITRQRFLEDELRNNANRLEKAVVVRTQELERIMKDLERANQKLRADDALKSEFVANVAHEIKNPLFLIRENIACVQDGLLGEIGAEAAKILKVAHKEIDRLLRLTGNMLDLIKLELGKMPLKKENFDLRTIFEDIVFTFKDESKKKNIELVAEIENNPLWIEADRDLMKEVVINLLNNALKYSPEGKRIVLRACGADGYVRLEVIDQGPGIPEEMREKVFDKFFRIFLEKAEGTGLGLSIVKEIVDAHEGQIWVEPGEGGGSKFVVLLKKGN